MSNLHVHQLMQALKQGPAVLVHVDRVQGSGPREVGAWMAVLADQVINTIGGGNLEFQAVDEARQMLGGAQAVPSELIPARELHQHLINQVATGAGNVVLADTAGKPAAVVMSIQRYQQLVDELNTLRRNNSDDT